MLPRAAADSNYKRWTSQSAAAIGEGIEDENVAQQE